MVVNIKNVQSVATQSFTKRRGKLNAACASMSGNPTSALISGVIGG